MKIYYNQETGLLQTTRLDNKNIILSGVVNSPFFELNIDPPVIGGALNLEFLTDIQWATTQDNSLGIIYDGMYLTGNWLLYPNEKASIRSRYPNLGESIQYDGALELSLAEGDDTLFVQNNNGSLLFGNWNQRMKHYAEFYRKKINAYWASAVASISAENTFSAAIAVKFESLLPTEDRVATHAETGFGMGIQNALIQEYQQFFDGDSNADDPLLIEGAISVATRVKTARTQWKQVKNDAIPQGEVYNTEQEVVDDYETVLNNLESAIQSQERRGRRNR